MASSSTMLRTSSCLMRMLTKTNRPVIMSQTKCLSSLTKINTHQSVVPSIMINSRSMGTKSDGELSKFLQEEIQTEKKNQRSSVKLDGWSVKTDGSEVTLTRDVGGGEQVMITLNVNHTVDSAQPDDGTEEVRNKKYSLAWWYFDYQFNFPGSRDVVQT